MLRDLPAVQAPTNAASGTQQKRRSKQETPRYRIGIVGKTPSPPRLEDKIRPVKGVARARTYRRALSSCRQLLTCLTGLTFKWSRSAAVVLRAPPPAPANTFPKFASRGTAHAPTPRNEHSTALSTAAARSYSSHRSCQARRSFRVAAPRFQPSIQHHHCSQPSRGPQQVSAPSPPIAGSLSRRISRQALIQHAGPSKQQNVITQGCAHSFSAPAIAFACNSSISCSQQVSALFARFAATASSVCANQHTGVWSFTRCIAFRRRHHQHGPSSPSHPELALKHSCAVK